MPGRGLARLVPLSSLALVMALGLTACGNDGDTDPPAGAETSATATDGPTTDDDSPDGDSTDDDSAAVTVTRDGDSFTPNGERVELGVDQTLVLTIDADEAGELHVHSTPEQDIAYDEGTSEHEITIDRPGVVEVESHDPDVIVLQLEVR